MNPLAKIMGCNITKQCKKNHMSPRELADRIGVPLKTMQNWISGERKITAYGLYRCAKTLGVTMESLMQGVDEPK